MKKNCSVKNAKAPSTKPTGKRGGYPSRLANVRKSK